MLPVKECSCVTVGKAPQCEQDYCIICGDDTVQAHYCDRCDKILSELPIE